MKRNPNQDYQKTNPKAGIQIKKCGPLSKQGKSWELVEGNLIQQ